MSTRASRPNRQGPADQVRTLIRRAGELVAPLDRADFNRRPADGGWSVAECLEHLNATARVYLPVIAEAIDDARSRGLVDGRRDGRTLLGRLITRLQEPPVRLRMKTFRELLPDAAAGTGLDREAVLDEFETLHEELIVRINEASDLDQRRIRIRSVLDSRLRLSLADWFVFLAAHGRRHLWQAEKVLEERADASAD